MAETLKRPRQLDVQAAVRRAKEQPDWSIHRTYTQVEGAFADRRTMADEIAWLHQELADTQDALREAETELHDLTDSHAHLYG